MSASFVQYGPSDAIERAPSMGLSLTKTRPLCVVVPSDTAYGEPDNAIEKALPIYLPLTREVSYMREYQQHYYIVDTGMPLRERFPIILLSLKQLATHGNIIDFSISKNLQCH
jgi:hypothetical protein